jgi:hypothetical protein
MANELIEILNRGHEAKDLDYKGPIAWDETNKKSCCELVKDILGMANTLGGYLVIGVSETTDGYTWEGLTAEQANSFDTTRVNRFLQNYADPPINTLLRKVKQDDKVFVIIEVPRFTDTPHVCQKEFPQVLSATALYVRTDNNETAPLRSSADFRAIVEQAIRNRGDTLLASVRSILKGNTPPSVTDTEQFETQWKGAVAKFDEINPLKQRGYTGYREATFFPTQFQADRFSMEQLRLAAERAHVNFTGWPFLAYSQSRTEWTYAIEDGLETLIEHHINDERLDFWQFRQSGFFYQRVLMWEEFRQRQKQEPSAMHIDSLAIYAAQAIDCLTRLYDTLLSDTDEVEFRLRVLGADKRRLETFDSRDLWGPYICRIPQVSFRCVMPLAEWRASIVEHADKASQEIFHRFNWEHPGSYRNIIEKMFQRRF